MQHIELLGGSSLGQERIVGWGDDDSGLGMGDLYSFMDSLSEERIVGWGGLGAFGQTATIGKCPSSLTVGTKFTGDILGIPWPMEYTKTLVGNSRPLTQQLTISKAKTPAIVATLIERNLAWFLPRTLEDFPDLLYKPTELLKIAKVRGGFYAGKANFDKYRSFLGKDLYAPKYTILETTAGPRRFSVLSTVNKALPITCNNQVLGLDDNYIAVVNDLGANWGVALLHTPKRDLLDQMLSPIVSLVKLIVKLITKAVDLIKAGIEALIQLFKSALALFCKAAQGAAAKLFDGYIKKLGSMETQIAEGKATTTNGTVSTQVSSTAEPGSISTSDAAYYNTQLKSLSGKLCASTPTLPPPGIIQPPKSLMPYFLVGGGILTAATLTAVGIKRRR